LILLRIPAFASSQEIRGTYPGFYEATSTKDKLKLWDEAIDYFTKHNFTVKSLNKENGIAVTSPDLMPHFSYSSKKKISFRDIEEFVGMSRLRPYYIRA